MLLQVYTSVMSNLAPMLQASVLQQLCRCRYLSYDDRDATLTFQVFADIEPANEYDRFKVTVQVLEGQQAGETIEMMNKSKLPTQAFKDFVSWSIDLNSFRGQTVQVSFTFDSIDEMNNAYEGVFIDDIQVSLGCTELSACEEDKDCDDGDPCTTSLCSAEGCVSNNICEEPGTEEPGTEEPVTEEPGTEEPGTEEPGTEEPGTEEPGPRSPAPKSPPRSLYRRTWYRRTRYRRAGHRRTRY